MIRVAAPARLHFGLLNPAAAEPWRTIDGEPTMPVRRFGGVGLMVEEPVLVVRVEPADEWVAHGPLAARALDAARRFAEATVIQPHAITVEEAPPEHSGFGTGTQLSLAVAKAIAIAAGRGEWSSVELAARVGRGERSGIGVHGFGGGGLIVEAGKLEGEVVAPLLLREALPAEWRIVIALPDVGFGRHGTAERESFTRLRHEGTARETEAMSRLVLLGMLPALRGNDCRAFGEAVYDYNARAGELFAADQGGRYAGPHCAALVAFLRGIGIAGVGQSSWGPGLFAIVADDATATDVRNQVHRRFGESVRTWITRPSHGAVVTA